MTPLRHRRGRNRCSAAVCLRVGHPLLGSTGEKTMEHCERFRRSPCLRRSRRARTCPGPAILLTGRRGVKLTRLIVAPDEGREPMFDRKRRDFITLIGGAAAWPLTARTQGWAHAAASRLDARSSIDTAYQIVCVKIVGWSAIASVFGLWARPQARRSSPSASAQPRLSPERPPYRGATFVKVTFFAKSTRMRKAECSGVGLSSCSTMTHRMGRQRPASTRSSSRRQGRRGAGPYGSGITEAWPM